MIQNSDGRIFCWLTIFILLGSSACQLVKKLHPYLDRAIAGEITLSEKDIYLKPEPSLQVQRKEQEVVLKLYEPIDVDFRQKVIRTASSEVILVEVELIDKQGKSYFLEPTSYILNAKEIGFSQPIDELQLNEGNTIIGVRLKASSLLRVSEVIWRCYNQSDLL